MDRPQANLYWVAPCICGDGGFMYAVVRAGGKQYRVAPGDVIKIETPAYKVDSNGKFEFAAEDVLAISSEPGKIGKPNGGGATVVGQVVDEGRGKKIIVFHFKRKKQYKKTQGHRQDFTAIRIAEISYDGHKDTAPELPARKAKKVDAAEAGVKAAGKSSSKGVAKKAAPKKSAAKKTAKKK
jgi:large subunit ribosomal protein L21